MCFLIFRPEGMLNLCLNSNESQPIYVYKYYAYKKVYAKLLDRTFA